MKKKLVYFMLTIFIAFILPVPVSAHQGRTDSNGGHYDRSTGEYHYHHGYPEHQHYDMDGDGDLDCPYDFDDRTGSNSGSTGSTYLSAEAWLTSQGENEDRYEEGYDSGYDDGYEKGNREGYEDGSKYGYDNGYTDGLEDGSKGKVSSKLLVVVAIISVVFAIMLRMRIKSLDETQRILDATRKNLYDSEQQEERLKEELKKVKQESQVEVQNAKDEAQNARMESSRAVAKVTVWASQYQKQNDAILRYLGLNQNQIFAHNNSLAIGTVEKNEEHGSEHLQKEIVVKNKNPIPMDISFACDGLPILGRQTQDKYYGGYTVYVCDRGAVYHLDKWCSNGYSRPVHLFEVVESRRPCARCCRRDLPQEIPQWYKVISAKREERNSKTAP